MDTQNTTCWTLIHEAAGGDDTARDVFARRYLPVARAYLGARWTTASRRQDMEDALQQVFVECFRDGGALQRVQQDRPGGFRAFLFGVTRNVALRVESRRPADRAATADIDLAEQVPASDDERLTRVFDRAWAQTVMRDAAARMSGMAADGGPDAARRVELLRLRFQEGLPIRDIADRWRADPVQVHREYARARKEFKKALMEVMSYHHPGATEEAESECARLLELLA